MPRVARARTRVLIIGGGPAALATAFELTAEDRATDYEVTILQPGWRLGGKCASGRNAGRGERIEEHGLHVWFGCYDNAFKLLDRCYGELQRSPDTHAFAAREQAFEGVDLSVLWQRRDEAWSPQLLTFPRHRTPPPNFLAFATEAVAWLGHRLVALHEELEADDDVELDFTSALDQAGDELAVFDLAASYAAGVGGTLARVTSRLYRKVAETFVDTAQHAVSLDELTHFLDAFQALACRMLPDDVRHLPDVIFFLDTTDLLIAVLRGVLKDDLLARGFDEINDVDLADWLKLNGADIGADPLEWPAALRGVYDGCFAFEEGDPSRPAMAAGRALQGAIRCLLHYRGSVLYRMRAGMGDTVIAPLYEALERRNDERNAKITVRFFHAAAALRPAPDGHSVAEVEVVEQAPLEGDYTPLREVEYGTDGCTVSAWSSEPPWDQLPDLGGTGPAVAARLEHEIDPFDGTRRTLKAGRDFDLVVLAVPPDVQREICTELCEVSQPYADMLEHSHTVVTQASQLWLSRSARDLGQPFDSKSLMSCFFEPLDTYCDMAHLLSCEQWSAGEDVKHVAYFCGVLPHTEFTTQAEADAAARRYLEGMLDTQAELIWTGPQDAPSRTALRDALAGGGKRAGKEARLAAQYWRANCAPTERYGLTLPGTVKHRLGPDEAGFRNLVLAGDWTRNGFDAGCVEAAVTSGLLAANAICGAPALDTIAGCNGPDGFPSRPRTAPEPGIPI